MKPPYLAVVSIFDQAGPDVEAGMRYRVHDVIGFTSLDTVIQSAPGDTIILPLEPSAYEVELQGIPQRCFIRGGATRQLSLTDSTNTNLARYIVSCRPSIGLTVYVSGTQPDADFVYRMRRSDGLVDTTGVIAAFDTLLISPVPDGEYSIQLAHVAPNCTTVNPGGDVQSLTVANGVRTDLAVFDVACSEPARQPRVLSIRGSTHDSAVAFVLRATDPDRDIARVLWDVTDCGGKSLRDGVAVDRRLTPERARTDTVVFLAGALFELPEQVLRTACVAARVVDTLGNTSAVAQYRLRETGARPRATLFNSFVTPSGAATRVLLDATDDDGDFVGTVVTRRVADGLIREPDGRDDFVLANAEGFLGDGVPDLPLGRPYPTQQEVNAVFVYLIDAGGNFSRYIDTQVFQ